VQQPILLHTNRDTDPRTRRLVLWALRRTRHRVHKRVIAPLAAAWMHTAFSSDERQMSQSDTGPHPRRAPGKCIFGRVRDLIHCGYAVRAGPADSALEARKSRSAEVCIETPADTQRVYGLFVAACTAGRATSGISPHIVRRHGHRSQPSRITFGLESLVTSPPTPPMPVWPSLSETTVRRWV
jgi:hypothetical protein